MRTVPSNPPERASASPPSPAKDTALTRPTCPWKRRVEREVATSQRKRVRSPPEERKEALEGEMERERMGWECRGGKVVMRRPGGVVWGGGGVVSVLWVWGVGEGGDGL